jgi:hypothetical protein
MKIKVKLNTNVEDLAAELEPKVKLAGAATAQQLHQRGVELAKQGFGTSGFKHWSKGYKFAKVDDGMFIISVEGRFANMMEDGIATGEISKMIMNGPRAGHNKAQGKDYVDVPIHKDADAAGQVSIQGEKFQVQAFKSADEMLKHFSKPERTPVMFTRGKNVGPAEDRIVSRSKKLENLIKSENPKGGSTAYMTLHRVSEKSVWPKSPYAGQHVLDKLSLEVEHIFATMLNNFFKE